MMLPALWSLLICLIAWLYVKWRGLKSYWARLGIPYVPAQPLVGSLTFLQRENPFTWLRRVYDDHNSPYVGLWLFQRPALLINSPEIARNVLVKDFNNFRDRFLSSGSSDPTGALNLFTVNDPIWTALRKRLSGVFTLAKLKSLQPLSISKSNELIQRIAMEKSENLSLRSLFSDITTDIIGAAAFGVAGDATLTGDSPMRAVTREFMKFSLHRGIAWCSIFFWPELVDIFRFTMFPKSSIRYFKKVFHILIEQRKDSVDKGEDPKDLLGALVKLRKEKECEDVVFSDDLIVSQGAIFLQGGYDTTAVTLAFGIYELAYNPEYQERLYSELLEAKINNNNSEFDTQTLSELVHLNCVIKETLRMYPAMGWLDRIAANDYQIDEKLTIRAGTPIYVNVVGMHYDPKYFPNPKKFMPERFLPENEKTITPYTYMPFGEGPRACIGSRFSKMNLQHILSRIIIAYEVSPQPNSPKPCDVKMEKHALFLAPGENLYVKFIPRK
ncbi:cytochrome P450 6k1-like [Zerene cesonia]|uniref:cytochrome P450 6k1-like n=1 Tax=Zerene cesonia TaxID=33412 RepID=UPI0018E5589E|nr:cytochrome P450 6k1-like [Zerene cesonia]